MDKKDKIKDQEVDKVNGGYVTTYTRGIRPGGNPPDKDDESNDKNHGKARIARHSERKL